jgi:hypothetical protein
MTDREFETTCQWARGVLAAKRKPRTIRTYQLMNARLAKKDYLLKLRQTESSNKNTRSVERAAVRMYIAEKIAIAAKNGDRKSVKVLANRLKDIAEVARENASRHYPAKGNKLRRKTKKKSLVGLPPDWRLRILGAAEHSRYYQAICVLAASGCRPAELEHGVEVRPNSRGDALIFIIRGAKVTEHNGHETRILTVSLDNPLCTLVPLGITYAKAKALNDAMRPIARKVFPKRAPEIQVSPYSFRHAAAGDFKSSGLSRETVAAALGHRSTRTQAIYGATRGRGMLKLVSVDVEAEIRVYEDASMPAREKIRDRKT